MIFLYIPFFFMYVWENILFPPLEEICILSFIL